MKSPLLAVALVLVAAACSRAPREDAKKEDATTSAPPEPAPAPSAAPVQFAMSKVRLHVTDGIVVDVERLRGEVIPVSGDVPVMTKPTTYEIRLASARIRVPPESLAAAMNEWIFEDGPVRDVEVSFAGGRMVMKGKLHGAPFESVSEVDVKDGLLRLTTMETSALGVGTTRLARTVGISIEDLIGSNEKRGLETRGDIILVDTSKSFPPPRLIGKVSKVTVEEDAMVLELAGDARGDPLLPPVKTERFIYHRKGKVGYGRQVMHDADMLLLDADPEDPFDYHGQRFEKEQLPVSRVRVRADGGTETYVQDWEPAKPEPK